MTLNLSVPTTTQELRPKITVIGVGGAGGNAVNNMIAANLEGIEFLVTNTDGQALAQSLATRKIQLGRQQTQGLGAGSKPEVGRIAAEESLDDILAELTDSHMVFITAGMGGGTGTGAAPVIAKAARERGILTVGVVTKPFDFEGQVRMRQANAGIEELQAYVDTLIIIPNQNLFRLANERTTFADAFAMADEVLHKGVCGITDLMIKPGDINLDFADIRSVMSEMGKAMMGTGEASGENRAANAAEAAINNPLLDETSMSGAQAVLINITGGTDMTLFEVDEAANHIRRDVDQDATIIIGSAIDDKMDGIMRVSVVATGMEAGQMAQRPHTPMAQPVREPIAQPALQNPTTQNPAMQNPGMHNMTHSFAQGSDELAEETIEEVVAQTPVQPVIKPVTQPEIMPEIEPEIDIPEEVASIETAEDQAEDVTASIDAVDDAEDHDDGQQHLEDLVAAAEAEEEVEASVQEEAEEDNNDAPFMMRDVVEIREEPAKEEAPKSLIGHIAGLMFASKPAKEEAEKAEEKTETRADKVDLMGGPVLFSTPQEETQPEVTAEVTAEAHPEIQPEAAPEASALEAEQEEAPQMGGLASLKPTDQPKLEMSRAGEDVDLDIPAFLRRQAN